MKAHFLPVVFLPKLDKLYELYGLY